jgi:cytochrome c biogenesis protein CcmG, thiol:disulfide interchange protein DsbE
MTAPTVPGDRSPDPDGDADADADGLVTRRRRPRTALFVVLPIALVLALFVGVLATRKPATDRKVFSPLVGRTAPALASKTIDGNRFDLIDTRGQWVVVNFFASWCVPCQREHPQLRAFAEQHDKTGDAQVVAVVFGDDVRAVQAFFAERGGDWPVVRDDHGGISARYGVAGVPETFIVSPDGVVRAKIASRVTAAGLDQLIAELGGPAS